MIAEPVRLDRVEFGSVVATPRTEWTFARLRDVEGAGADVELTAGDATPEAVKLVAEAVASLRGAAIDGEATFRACWAWTKAFSGATSRWLRR